MFGTGNTNKWRHVVYCCYQPRDMASEEDLQLNKQAWDNYMVSAQLRFGLSWV